MMQTKRFGNAVGAFESSLGVGILHVISSKSEISFSNVAICRNLIMIFDNTSRS